MAVPKWYVNGLKNVMNGSINLDDNTGLKLMLVTSSYTPNQTTHATGTDYGANEATAPTSGYTAGGYDLGTTTLTASGQDVTWDVGDISQAITGTLTFRYGIFYKEVGAASADLLIGYVDFGAQTVTDATLNVTLTNPFKITAAS